MEHLIDAQHGPVALLASLVVVLALHLLLKVGEFAWKLVESKQKLKENQVTHLISMVASNTADLTTLKDSLDRIKTETRGLLEHSKKTELNTRRLFAALKKISGKDWPEIRKHMIEDEI